jgi:hypothetical protein
MPSPNNQQLNNENSKVKVGTPKTTAVTTATPNEGTFLTLNSANGDSISIPATLSEPTIQNIIKIFLCCK